MFKLITDAVQQAQLNQSLTTTASTLNYSPQWQLPTNPEAARQLRQQLDALPPTDQFVRENDQTGQAVEIQCKSFTLLDERGGSAYITLQLPNPNYPASPSELLPHIIQINSVPWTKRYTPEEPTYKRRGFFKATITALKMMGFPAFHVGLQSQDSQHALQRLTDKGIVQNPRDPTGSSTAQHPTTFDIVAHWYGKAKLAALTESLQCESESAALHQLP